MLLVCLLILTCNCTLFKSKPPQEEKETLVGKNVSIILTTGNKIKGLIIQEDDESLVIQGESGNGKIPRTLILSVDVIEEEEVSKPMLSGKVRPRHRQIKFVAGEGKKLFHRPNCRFAREIPIYKKLTFESREEAIRRGFKPCGFCNP